MSQLGNGVQGPGPTGQGAVEPGAISKGWLKSSVREMITVGLKNGRAWDPNLGSLWKLTRSHWH